MSRPVNYRNQIGRRGGDLFDFTLIETIYRLRPITERAIQSMMMSHKKLMDEQSLIKVSTVKYDAILSH